MRLEPRQRRPLATAPLVDIRHKLPPLRALTSVRFVAAVYVALYHLDLQARLAGWPHLANFLASGYTGVTLFFLLSGFILAYNYPQVRDRREFWLARFARVYPLYFATCCFCALRPSQWHRPELVLGTVLAFLMLQTVWPPFSGALNQYGWTLSVEALFYLVFPFVLPLVRRLGWRSFLAIQAGYLGVVCLPLVLAALHRDAAAAQWAAALDSRSPLVRMNPFLVGMYFGLGHARRAASDRQPQRRTRLGTTLTVCVAVTTVLLAASLPVTAMPLRTCLLTYTCAGILLALARGDWRLFAAHWLQVGGEISYGIYILQFPVVFVAYQIGQHLRAGPSLQQTGGLVLLIPAAYVSFRWFETPVRLALRRAFNHERIRTRVV